MFSLFVDTALWLLAIELIGLATLPLSLRVFYGLPDRGYAAAKTLGLVLIAYGSWLTGILGLTAFTGSTIGVLTVGLAVASWWSWGHHVVRAWKESRGLAIAAEVTFVIAFLLAVGVRSYNAAIAGQEKQMDFTFLHSLIRSDALPAEDLWLAGHGMPYYYFGYLTQSLIGKVLPIDPAVAYNMALATVLATSAIGAFGLTASLIALAGAGRRAAVGAGAIGAFALTVMGNLEALFELIAAQGFGESGFWSAVGIKNLQAPSGGFPPSDGAWWFRAARVIPNIQPDGITEFPYFSFLLGDLHPHYMAIPLGVLIVTLAAHELAILTPPRAEPIRMAVSAIVLGAVIPSNTWDVPVFWGVFALAVAAAALRGASLSGFPPPDRILQLGVVFLLAALSYAPYFVGYVSQPLGIGLVAERTYFGSLFVLFGPLLVLPLVAGGVAAARAFSGGEGGPEAADGPAVENPGPASRFPHLGRVLLGGGFGGGVLLMLAGEPTLGFLVASLSLWLPLTWARARSGVSPSGTATAIMVSVGLGSILVAEIVFLRDVFGSRMNTVFKFYYDAWILLALVAPLLVGELLAGISIPGLRRGATPGARGARERAARGAGAWLRGAAAAGLGVSAVLALGGAIYPIAATHTKSGGFAAAPTLDGLSYLRAFRPDDVSAIEWLRHVRPRGGIVEGVGHDYTDAGRFSTFAGLPTLIGWVGHEVQWRGQIAEIERRQQLARRVYTEAEVASWRSLLEQLGMQFVVVGNFEREIYGGGALARIDEELPVAHRSGSTTIYALASPARPEPG